MPKFNGHRNWNHWNVSLWINNDEGLYRLATERIAECRTKRDAAESLLNTLAHQGERETPDGARYSISSILAALRGM